MSATKRIPIWLKFAIPTTILIVALVLLVGILIADRMQAAVDKQINNQGTSLALVAGNATPPILHRWPADPNNYDALYPFQEPAKEWLKNLNALVESEGRDILDVIVTEDREPSKAHLALSQQSYGVRPSISFTDSRPLSTSPTSNVQSFEGLYNGQKARLYLFPKGANAESPEAYVGIFVSTRQLEEMQSNVQATSTVLAGIAAILGLVGCLMLANYLTRPIMDLVKDLRVVEEGHLDHRTAVATNDEIGMLAATFNDMVEGLQEREKLQAEKQRVESELSIATEIQQKLLPSELPDIPGYDIHAFYQSALEVSGDYYDFMELQQDRHGIVVADVSGKGIPGSMVMTMARGMIRMASVTSIDPAHTIKRSNATIYPDIRRGMFITCMYGILDPTTSEMKLISAGHNPLLVRRAADGSLDSYNPGGMGIGIDGGRIFDRILEVDNVKLEVGDIAVMSTDGVDEAMSEENVIYGDETLQEFVRQNGELTTKEFVEKLVADLARHRGNAEQSDDITIVAIKRTS